jgi:uncharacterized protein DUF3455
MRGPTQSKLTQTAATFASVVLVGLILGSTLTHAEKISPPKVPDAISAHPAEGVVVVAHASGSQIYACRPGTDGSFSWTLKAPDAELKDDSGKVIGSHFAGPTWKLNDGSQVTGKASAHVDSPDDPNWIPWLRVDVITHSGQGLLTRVTTIQRIHTHGGKPPAQGCDKSLVDSETKSSYTADYYFYAPAE